MTPAIGPVNPRAVFVNPDGTLTPQAFRALALLTGNVANYANDKGLEVFAPFVQDAQDDIPQVEPRAPFDEMAEVVQQPTQGGETWPIGAVFISLVSTDPATLFGYGTWSSLGARFLVGYLAGDPDFGIPGATGGARTLDVADHPNHTHDVVTNVTASTAAVQSGVGTTVVTGLVNNTITSAGTSATLSHVQNTTGTHPMPILPPSITVYMWQRTA